MTCRTPEANAAAAARIDAKALPKPVAISRTAGRTPPTRKSARDASSGWMMANAWETAPQTSCHADVTPARNVSEVFQQ